MTIAYPNPAAYPFSASGGLELADEYLEAQRMPGMLRVQLPHGEPAWLATRYADVRMVLGDSRFSRAESTQRDEPRLQAARITSGLLSMDPPEHTRLRGLIAKAFTVKRGEALRAQIRWLGEDLIDNMIIGGPPADLVHAFALPLPVAVICQLLGVPAEDRPRFRRWSDDLLSTTRLTQAEAEASRDEMLDYMARFVVEKRRDPADDLMTALIQARDKHDRLSEPELVFLCAGILIAGHETTANHISNFIVTLLDHPNQLAKLRDDLTLLSGAVEELLRFIPIRNGETFARYATEDVLVGDVLVREGDAVLPAIGAANRDPMRFDDAGKLRIDRPVTPHIAFGHGVHHCPGASLARIELQEALRVLLERLPSLRLAGDVNWKKTMIVRGVVSMPVTW